MIFFALLFSLAAQAGALWPRASLTCEKGGMYRYRYAGSMQQDHASFCYDEARAMLVSENCAQGACEALQEKICELPVPRVPSFEGPGLCGKLGGVRQEGAFYDGKAWWDMDRCLFVGDKSFVDSGTLGARRAQCFDKRKP